jgi:hypothetical protein
MVVLIFFHGLIFMVNVNADKRTNIPVALKNAVEVCDAPEVALCATAG